MKFFKIDFQKIKKIFEKLAISMIEKGFLTLILIFFFSLLFGFLIFYKYGLSFEVGKKEKVEFQGKLFEKILKEWQEREKKFQEIDTKIYLNPFQ